MKRISLFILFILSFCGKLYSQEVIYNITDQNVLETLWNNSFNIRDLMNENVSPAFDNELFDILDTFRNTLSSGDLDSNGILKEATNLKQRIDRISAPAYLRNYFAEISLRDRNIRDYLYLCMILIIVDIESQLTVSNTELADNIKAVKRLFNSRQIEYVWKMCGYD